MRSLTLPTRRSQMTCRRLRIGIASGCAVSRAGDWFGSPVNVASRVTAAARPGCGACHGVDHGTPLARLVTSSGRRSARGSSKGSAARSSSSVCKEPYRTSLESLPNQSHRCTQFAEWYRRNLRDRSVNKQDHGVAHPGRGRGPEYGSTRRVRASGVRHPDHFGIGVADHLIHLPGVRLSRPRHGSLRLLQAAHKTGCLTSISRSTGMARIDAAAGCWSRRRPN